MRSSMQTRTTEDGQEIHNLVKGLTFVHTSGTMLGIYLCCSAWSVYYSSRFADMLFFAAYLVFENCETLTLLTWSPPLIRRSQADVTEGVSLMSSDPAFRSACLLTPAGLFGEM